MNGHGSTGGAESSNPPSEDELFLREDPLLHAVKGKDLVSDEVLEQYEEPKEKNNFSDVHKMHMIQTLQGLLFIRSLSTVSQEEIDTKKVYLPPPNHPSKKKVIVFDLDETLVH